MQTMLQVLHCISVCLDWSLTTGGNILYLGDLGEDVDFANEQPLTNCPLTSPKTQCDGEGLGERQTGTRTRVRAYVAIAMRATN